MNVILVGLMNAGKLIFVTFIAIFAILLALLVVKPKKYEAHMTFLVRDERAKSLVSADPAQNGLQKEDLIEERINSEAELLASAGILRAVVLDQGLENEFLNATGKNQAEAVERATRKLSQHLEIFGVRKSALINVTYTSPNPDQAKNVLDSLSRKYLSEYVRLHSDSGAASFYQQKLSTIETTLRKAQTDRARLLQRNGFMLLPEGQGLGLRQLVSLEQSRNETKASLAETESRLASVKYQQSSSSTRLITQKKSSANQLSVEQLNTKLVDLRNQLTALHTKFLDSDPLVLQAQQQIADTKAALDDAEEMHSEDTTSDINPIRQALDGQANQLSQGTAGLRSRLNVLDQQIREGKTQLSETEQASIAVDTQNRDIKVLQDSAEFYQSRSLAAAAADEMDSEKFSNVVEATHPTVPVLPSPSGFNIVSSFLLAVLVALGAGLVSVWRNRQTIVKAKPSIFFQPEHRA